MTPSTLSRLGIALLFALSAGVLPGCRTVELMSRPDDGATMARPEDWARAASRDGVLFELEHRLEPVRIRLRRLPAPIAKDAHIAWALLWLEETFDAVEIIERATSTVSGARATLIRAQIGDADHDLIEQLHVVNRAGQTYVLEIWGAATALDKTAEDRREIVASVVLPSAAAEASESGNLPGIQESRLWKLTLPDPALPALEASWHIDSLSPDAWRLRLPARLITAEVTGEKLDYPVDATTYARVALEHISKRDGTTILPVPGSREVRVADIFDEQNLVPMHVEYRFITRGERAVQIAVSTPVALYENNREVIEALVDSVRLKQVRLKKMPAAK
jgi:hypothetical protein